MPPPSVAFVDFLAFRALILSSRSASFWLISLAASCIFSRTVAGSASAAAPVLAASGCWGAPAPCAAAAAPEGALAPGSSPAAPPPGGSAAAALATFGLLGLVLHASAAILKASLCSMLGRRCLMRTISSRMKRLYWEAWRGRLGVLACSPARLGWRQLPTPRSRPAGRVADRHRAGGGPGRARDAARRASGGAPGNRVGDARTHLVLVPALAVGSPLALVRVVGRSLLRALRRRGRRARRKPQRAAPAQHFFERGLHGLRRPLDGRPLHVALLGDGLCEQVELLLLLEELRLLRGEELGVLLRLVLVMILLLGQLRCKVLGLLGHLLGLLLLLLLLVQLVLRGRGGRRGLVLQRRQLGHGRRRAQLHLGLLLVLLLLRRLLLRAVLVHCDEQQAVARPAAHRDRL